MRFTKLSSCLLAGTIAVAGQAALAAAPAFAMTPVSELKDVSPDHWAYNAIQTLIEKYQVMEGFPDRSFRGSKTLTRYEMAAALAKVMARVEERIAIATGQPINVDPGVNPEDLRTIARLQREFREELDALKSRVDTIDSRVMSLEKRVKISGNNRTDFRDWVSDPIPAGATSGMLTGQPSADFRFRNSLMFDAQLMDDLAFMGTFNLDLYPPQSLGNAYLRGTTASPMTDVYAPNLMVNYTPGWITYGAGVGAMRNQLCIGSPTMDPFKMNTWQNGTGGYGFVGTPGWNPGGAGVASMLTPGGGVGAPLWLPGTNVIVDVIDPNNSSLYAPHGSVLSAGHVALGPLKVGLGFQRGAVSGPAMFSSAVAMPASLPGLQTWGMGSTAVATLGLDLGVVRLNTVATSPAVTGTLSSVRDKTVGMSVDLGGESLGLTAEVLGNTSFSFSDYAATKGSLRLGMMNIMDTGFGLGAGVVTGNIAGMRGTASGLEFVRGNSLFANQADYTSMGAMIKTPAIFIIPSFTVAAQNTRSGMSFQGASVASGLTASTDITLFGLPTMTLEYSRGKFGATTDNTLWGAGAFTHDQVGASTVVKF